MKNRYVYSHNPGSKSGRVIADLLGCARIKHKGSAFRGAPRKAVINWGASYHRLPPEVQKCRVINKTGSINKLEAFNKLSRRGISIPPYTEDKKEARAWQKRGFDVVERHKLLGHSGQGIRLCAPPDELKDAPLYTRYVKKEREFRAHTFIKDGTVVAIIHEKKGKNGKEKNWQIRNHANGFVYTRDPVDVPDCIKYLAYDAIYALGLDFGAVDIIYNNHEAKGYVLEVNTAPGMDGVTKDVYQRWLAWLTE